MPFLEQSSSAKPTRDANAGGMEVSSLSDKPSFFRPWHTNNDLFGRGYEVGGRDGMDGDMGPDGGWTGSLKITLVS